MLKHPDNLLQRAEFRASQVSVGFGPKPIYAAVFVIIIINLIKL